VEEVSETRVEDAQVLRAGDAVAFVFEGEEFVGDAMLFEGFRDGVDVVRSDVRVLRALDDQEVPLMFFTELIGDLSR
jgi:hypothetical protein